MRYQGVTMKVLLRIGASLVLLAVAACSSSSEGSAPADLGSTSPSEDPDGTDLQALTGLASGSGRARSP